MSLLGNLFNFSKNKNKGKGKEGEKKTPTKEEIKNKKSVQAAIPYTRVFKDGTIETKPNHYTRAYNLGNVNFKIAPNEEQVAIFRAYGDFLNTFSPEVHFQIVIQNSIADRRTSLENIRFALRQGDKLNKHRQEMNGILLDKMSEGGRGLTQDKYLVVSIENEDIDRAFTLLNNVENEVRKGIRRISRDVDVKRQTIEDRLSLMFNIYNQDGQSVFYNDFKEVNGKQIPYFNYDRLLKFGMSSKDLIAPSGMEFKGDHSIIGGSYGRSMYLENVPTWLSTEFISDLSDIQTTMLISINHVPVDTAKAVRMIKNQLTAVNGQIANSQKQAVQSGYTPDLIAPSLQLAQKQTRELMDDVVGRDQKLFFVTLTLTIFAEDKEQLDEFTRMITSVANKYLCPIKTLLYQQEQGFNTSLPLALNELQIKRLLTTESASIFIPYTSLELYQKNGIYYGLNQSSNNLILYDRLSGKNFNGLIFGESGSGKSFFAKREMASVLLRSDRNVVCVIDPESEYSNMARAFGGEVAVLAPGSQTFVNPLDMDLDYDGGDSDPVSMKVDYIVSMIEIMLGDGRALDPQARSIVGRCVKNIYRPYLSLINKLREKDPSITSDKEAMPTLGNLYNDLLLQPEPEARTIATVLEAFATGAFNIFANPSNVDTQKRFLVYDIKNLGTGMKNLGLHVCLNDIWNKMIENRRKGLFTWIYIDEFYLLLQSDSAAKFLMQVWKRARKWQGVPTGIMQNTEDLLRSLDSRNILNNTSFIAMLSLPKLDRTNLSDLLQIPDSQLEYITNSQPGYGLIYNGKTIIPFKDEFPEDTEIFKLMNTTNKERFTYMGEPNVIDTSF